MIFKRGPVVPLSALMVVTEPQVAYVHLWRTADYAICGATTTGHPECAGTGPAQYSGWPYATDPWCPECFRPLCPICRSRR